MKISLSRLLVLTVLLSGLLLSASSCGTQKMGCPGQITQTEQSTEAQS